MHSVLEGTFKHLMKFWFDQKFHSQPYSLRRSMQTINQLINKIKPTDQIRRLPWSLDHLSFLKHQNINRGCFSILFQFYHFFYHQIMFNTFLCWFHECTFFYQIIWKLMILIINLAAIKWELKNTKSKNGLREKMLALYSWRGSNSRHSHVRTQP